LLQFYTSRNTELNKTKDAIRNIFTLVGYEQRTNIHPNQLQITAE